MRDMGGLKGYFRTELTPNRRSRNQVLPGARAVYDRGGKRAHAKKKKKGGLPKCAVIKSTWRRDHHTNFMKCKQKG
eukprot:scaffold53722_cov66-Phaeocystis_antarctica.AAC.1